MSNATDPRRPLAASNTRVKEARKLRRRSVRTERRLFLADGPKAVEGALGVPGCVQEVFATPEAAGRYADLLGVTPATLVDQRALASLSESVSPAGVVAVCAFLDVPLEEALAKEPSKADQLVICADVRDPGNAGTIIRTADAVAAHAVVLAGHSVDAYNDKTVRASVGSMFHLPLVTGGDPAEVVAGATQAGWTVLAADGAGQTPLSAVGREIDGPVAWLFGNEAWGLPDELAALADHRVAIPIPGRAESLNLSTAAAICLYAQLL